MTDHSCAMGMPSQVSATAQREVNAAPPLGHTDQQVRERTDLDALSPAIPEDSRSSWPGGDKSHFASIVIARVATMTEQSSDGPFDAHPGDGEGLLDETALAAADAALHEARARLAEVPAEIVVTNHVMGLYELAAIHLSADPVDLVSAKLAIDAVGCLIDGLGNRLGEEIETLRAALSTIQMAFVQVSAATGQHTS